MDKALSTVAPIQEIGFTHGKAGDESNRHSLIHGLSSSDGDDCITGLSNSVSEIVGITRGDC